MNCQSAAEILSAAHDGPVSADELALAKQHCDACSQCAAFRDMLARIDSVPTPVASPELKERLNALGTETAVAIRTEQAAQEAVILTASPQAARESVLSRWTPRLTAYVAAAAVLVLAVGITTARLVNMSGTHEAAEREEAAVSADSLEEVPVAPENGKQDDAVTGAVAEAAAPDYVTLEAGVWVLAGPASPSASTLTTAGVVVSSLGDPVSPGSMTAFWTSPDADNLYVRAADGAYLAFDRVTRTLGRRPYQLQSGTTLTQYGQWPTLPEAYPQPTAADGSPTFRFFGIDDLGVQVYVPSSGRVEDGFAVPPGTATTDPATGNPGWTWWEPYD